MNKHQRFHYHSLQELRDDICSVGAPISLSEDLSVFGRAVPVGSRTAPNAFAVLPMEGCDCNPDGSPSELTRRRYRRLAGGGSGLIWWEACAVVPEGRANPLQMMLTKQNADEYRAFLEELGGHVQNEMGQAHRPLHILQLTHSGRYARPQGHSLSPIIPVHDPYLDKRIGIGEDYPLVTDSYLDSLIAKYAESAKLAQESGFDGVDIKACHRYLMSELLASYTRQGRYGGSFENRTRLFREVLQAIRRETGPDFIIATRFNAFDAHPYPYGFGENREDFMEPDPTEPLAFVQMACENGIDLISNSAGNPYYLQAHVTRPYDLPDIGTPLAQEHPLTSIARLFELSRKIQKQAGDIPVVGNGYSWLRQFLPYAGASNLADGSISFVGLGRSSFAYPDAPKDLLRNGAMDSKKCCVACSKCTQIMRDHGTTGCVMKDAAIYAPLYRKFRAEAESRDAG